MDKLEIQHSVLNTTDAESIAEYFYGLRGRAVALVGERDLNFRLQVGESETYVLKIHHANSDFECLHAQNALLKYLNGKNIFLDTPKLVDSSSGSSMPTFLDSSGNKRPVRLLSWLEGKLWSESQKIELSSLGQSLAGLDHALRDFDHAAAHRGFTWSMDGAINLLDQVKLVQPDNIQSIVKTILIRFKESTSLRFQACRKQIIHNDVNSNNVLLNEQGCVTGLIDFGDLVYSPLITELAVASTYSMFGEADPVTAVLPLISAYHEIYALLESEIAILYDLILVRLAMSACNAAFQSEKDPDNTYLLVNQQDVRDLLLRLQRENGQIVHFRFRDACGFIPNPNTAIILRYLNSFSDPSASIVPLNLKLEPKWIMDLQSGSPLALEFAQISSTRETSELIDKRMIEMGVKVGIGRYMEPREVYTAKEFETGNENERRTVHLGIDIFMPGETPISAPLAGTVAFFNDNTADLDYGPVIILEHKTDDGTAFWTKYGHLSRNSLIGLEIGQAISRGEKFAHMGSYPENGNWPPHVHFQILTDLLGMGTDIHGVAVASIIDIWESIAPNPNLILQIPEICMAAVSRSKEYLVEKRKYQLGRNLSLSYQQPLKIVKGRGQYLYDEQGMEWLDMVNNVCHVGHCHPHVVEAGQNQMAKLNTNTRYLHDNIISYSRRLLATFPAPLSVCFFVNSGSEANDLALRLVRNVTAAKDMLVLDHAYHGNLTSLIEISPYKFNGPGGKGCPSHVHVCEMPDGYRGPVKYDNPQLAATYAADVTRHLQCLASDEKTIAGFIAESVLGCGGQVFLPDGYLTDVYRQVRAVGGLCIADEVQVGFGRIGSHFWAFEKQGVVPDVVTLGKPIGNGHPLAAVITTPAIANAFVNGMEYFNTFGGNPVSCAIGNAVLDVLEHERLQTNAKLIGEQMLTGLKQLKNEFDLIGDIRGSGLFIGIELVKDKQTLEPADEEASRLVEEMKKQGILLSTDGPFHNVIKIKPPICFNELDCGRFLNALEHSFISIGN